MIFLYQNLNKRIALVLMFKFVGNTFNFSERLSLNPFFPFTRKKNDFAKGILEIAQ